MRIVAAVAVLAVALLACSDQPRSMSRSPAAPSPWSTPPVVPALVTATPPTCPVDYLTTAPQAWKTECNFQWGIQVSYPPGWKAPNGLEYDLSLAQADKPDGEPQTVPEVCGGNLFAGHTLRPYGTQPAILPVTVAGQEACFVLPSADQPGPMNNAATVVFKLPVPQGPNEFGHLTFKEADIAAVASMIRFFGPQGLGRKQGATDSPPSALDRCHSSQLGLNLYSYGSTMMQPRADFRFTNQSSRPCQMWGWPGFQMLDAQGRWLDTRARRGTGLFITRGPEFPNLVTLPPGGSAFFGVGWVLPVLPGPCISPTQLLITPPDETASLEVPASSTAGTVENVCQDGAVTILPVQPVTFMHQPQ